MTAFDPESERYRLHAELCKVLTDPKRLALLDALRSGDRSVGDLAVAIGATLANTSQHLAVMRAAGLVEGTRDGTTVRYRIAEPAITAACDIVHGIVDRRLARRAASDLGAGGVTAAVTPNAATAPAMTGPGPLRTAG